MKPEENMVMAEDHEMKKTEIENETQ